MLSHLHCLTRLLLVLSLRMLCFQIGCFHFHYINDVCGYIFRTLTTQEQPSGVRWDNINMSKDITDTTFLGILRHSVDKKIRSLYVDDVMLVNSVNRFFYLLLNNRESSIKLVLFYQ